MNVRNERLVRSKIRQEALMWYMTLPVGPVIIAAGAWYAQKNNMLGPVPANAPAIWAKIQPFFWLGSAAAFGIGAWIRIKLMTPEAINRMRAPRTQKLGMSSYGVAARPKDLDEEGNRLWDLFNKILTRSTLSAGFLDAPVMVLIGFYLMNRTTWFLGFIVAYSLFVGIMFRPQGRKAMVETALKLQAGEKIHSIITE